MLLVSIVFHASFLFGTENNKNNPSASAVSASPQTIDRNLLSTILAEHDARLANLSSEKSAALALPDPSK